MDYEKFIQRLDFLLIVRFNTWLSTICDSIICHLVSPGRRVPGTISYFEFVGSYTAIFREALCFPKCRKAFGMAPWTATRMHVSLCPSEAASASVIL